MTKTFGELEEKVDDIDNAIRNERLIGQQRDDGILGLIKRIEDLERRTTSEANARVRDLEILLNGDQLTRTEWVKQKDLGVTPNISEPPIGVLQAIDNTFAAMSTRIADLHVVLGKRIDETTQRFVFISKLESFFGPMIQDKNPPLDGNQIADKAYVDASVLRVSSAMRSEFTAAVAFVAQLLKTFAQTGADVIGDTVSVQIMRATSRIVDTWERERARQQAEAAKKDRPSRIQSLIYAVTGSSPTNGARR